MDYIEPMTLGSPINSPGHGSPPVHQPPHGSQFLPGYLMGDVSSINLPTSPQSRKVSGKNQFGTPLVGTSSKSPPARSTPQSSKHVSYLNPSFAKDKVGTPPVHALMDDFNHPDASYPSNTPAFTELPVRQFQDTCPSYGGGTPVSIRRTQTLTPRRTKTPPSPGQSDPFYTQGELITPNSHLDDTWVTVFGFSPSSASFVVQRFSQYGTIVSHHTASNGGNWMHIHYETALQARKALSRNGKILPGNMMIGVLPCIDVKLMSDEQSALRRKSVYQSPAQQVNLSRNTTPVRPSKPASIRPLTAAYNAASSDFAVSTDVSTPQKTNGIITKAIDYIFG